MTTENPPIQPIVNLIVVRDGQALLVRYDADNPAWWLPGGDLLPYEHPDEAASRVLADLSLNAHAALSHIESFRGRRGWHLIFHYRAEADTDPASDAPFVWSTPANFPRTAHGDWERDNAQRAIADSK
jgi:ADP-ribose pyrophosphatase YjhB (NUDIX family)